MKLFASGSALRNPTQERGSRRLDDWKAATFPVRRLDETFAVRGLVERARDMEMIRHPGKGDQDKVDSALCVLIGLIWRAGDADASVMLGDAECASMIAPASSSNMVAAREGRHPTRGADLADP
jgi:predicted RNase H-like nuclease